jgi:hypothetical protein
VRGDDNDPFRSFLRSLPDEIARAAERDQPIVYRCDVEPPEHVRRLMATLGVPIVSTDPRPERARTMGNFTPTDEPGGNGHREPDWIDYRASRARARRRADAGETVVVCDDCETELDVDQPVHSPRCKIPTADAIRRVLSEPPRSGPPARGPDPEAVALALELLRTAARELADVGATDEAIAVHFANVCTLALERLSERDGE